MGAPREPHLAAADLARGRRAALRRMFNIPFLDLPPLHGAAGTVRLPGSKSISNRVLLLAGLAAGTTAVHDLLDSDDTARHARRAARAGLRPASATARRAAHHRPRRPAAGARGQALPRQCRHRDAPADGRAGGAGRHAGRRASSCRGVPRMHERPIGDLVDALRPLGCPID